MNKSEWLFLDCPICRENCLHQGSLSKTSTDGKPFKLCDKCDKEMDRLKGIAEFKKF